MRKWKAVVGIGLLVTVSAPTGPLHAGAGRIARLAQGGVALDPVYLDKLLAPVALYPDQLLAQILLCSADPGKLRQLSGWLKQTTLQGSALQQAAEHAGFEPSFVALAPFPQVVDLLAGNVPWTTQIGRAFAEDRAGVFDSIQRLRKQSRTAGNLKSTAQQTVETKTTQSGEQVIVIEPANPQVIYVPQYDPQVVYTQPATTTVVVHHDDNDEAAAALVGFAAGVAIGAAFDNHYYYGPHGWYGGARMYNDGWNDWYDDRADAREDWYENREDAREDYRDNREDMAGERSDRAQDAREQRTERAEGARDQRSERAEGAQAQRGERTGGAQQRAAGRQEASGTASTQRSSGERGQARAERSGTRSDAFSGYASGQSTRSASSRGERSRSSGGRSSRR